MQNIIDSKKCDYMLVQCWMYSLVKKNKLYTEQAMGVMVFTATFNNISLWGLWCLTPLSTIFHLYPGGNLNNIIQNVVNYKLYKNLFHC